jgi:hypothetical protein
MKVIWTSGVVVLLLVAVLVLVHQKSGHQTVTNSVRVSTRHTVTVSSNQGGNLPRDVLFRKRVELDETQLAALNVTFEEKLKPVIEKWCEAYAGHIPFRPEELSSDHFHSKISRGTSYCLYTFIIDGVTLSVEDVRGTVRVAYLNAPESKKLMQLPKGTPPDPSIPVTRDQVAKMLKLDSGRDFAPG